MLSSSANPCAHIHVLPKYLRTSGGLSLVYVLLYAVGITAAVMAAVGPQKKRENSNEQLQQREPPESDCG